MYRKLYEKYRVYKGGYIIKYTRNILISKFHSYNLNEYDTTSHFDLGRMSTV